MTATSAAGRDDTRLGIALMLAATLVLSVQDGVSRHLASEYNVLMVVTIRYWFFAGLVIAMARRRNGGIRATAATAQPILQILRGVLLAVEICLLVLAFTLLGLVESHAIFACSPLIVAALSGPVLGERLGPRRWAAIGAGAVGALIIIRPGADVFSPAALIAIASTFMFAAYSVLNRYVARRDTAATSFFWTGIVGAAVLTPFGLWTWEPMRPPDMAWMAVLCVLGATGHYLIIRCYEAAEASVLQPFAYFQLVFASMVGVIVFGDVVAPHVMLGASIVVAAGLFTLWRSRRAELG